MNFVLAIDPGTYASAWVLYNPEADNPIVAHGKHDNLHLLKEVFFECDFDSVVDEVAIEMVQSFGMSVGQSVFETCVWIGRFVQFFFSHAIPTTYVYRKDVKMHLCHNMRAKDGNIRQALMDRIGPQGNKKSPGPTYGLSGDEWSALAVAVTFCGDRQSVKEAV